MRLFGSFGQGLAHGGLAIQRDSDGMNDGSDTRGLLHLLLARPEYQNH